MNDDVISRQAVIDLWEQYHPYIAIKACEYDAKLRRLPSAQADSKELSFTHKALDTISRQAAIDTINVHLNKTDVPVSYPGIIKALEEWLNDLPSAQPEYTEQDVREAFNAGYACGMSAARPEWHECFEDDPDSFPSDERMVLMSFSNFPTPAIGWFERDDNGGYWTDGDPKTLIELGLFVDGWWELPRKPRRN